MAKTRVFVSSTYYDLKHIRASLDVFIDSLGFESILSEKGDIAYSPDIPLDESCYKEVRSVDILVLIIGGRYGAAAGSNKIGDKTFYTRYESITRKEFEEAISRDIPTYILIDNSVYAEFQTFQRNKDNKNINYAHVDSVNIFNLIEDISTRPKNNPIKTFERFSDIELWLRDQWSGLFRELLQRMSAQKQLSDLNSQVNELRAINDTLKSYMESMIRKIDPDSSDRLIEVESDRLVRISLNNKLKSNEFVEYMTGKGVELSDIVEAVTKSRNRNTLSERIVSLLSDRGLDSDEAERIAKIVSSEDMGLRDVNGVRSILGLKKYEE